MTIRPKAPDPRPEAAEMPSAIEGVPPLRPGQRLDRAEFVRRYDAMPHLKKAELIDGVVYMPSPVCVPDHGDPHFQAGIWVGNYTVRTPGVRGSDNASVSLDQSNIPQPDLFLRILPEYGGRSHIGPDKYLDGAPEFVFEVAASSASYDLREKLTLYQQHTCPEYVVWRVLDRAVSWFVLQEGRYVSLPPGPDSIFRSVVFPGLWLDPAALVADDITRVLAVLSQGLASPEHAAFVAALRDRAT
jgi:Uma2 family endonuclease